MWKNTCRLLPLIINYMTNYLLAFSFLTGVFLASTFRDKSRLSILWKWDIIFFLGNVFVLPTPVLISGRKYSSYTRSSTFIEKYIDKDFKRVSCMYWHNWKKKSWRYREKPFLLATTGPCHLAFRSNIEPVSRWPQYFMWSYLHKAFRLDFSALQWLYSRWIHDFFDYQI